MSITLRLNDFRAAVARGLQKITGSSTQAPSAERDTLQSAHGLGSANSSGARALKNAVAPQTPGSVAHQTLQSLRQGVKYTFSERAETSHVTNLDFGASTGVPEGGQGAKPVSSSSTLATCNLNYPLALSKGSAFAYGQANIGHIPFAERAQQNPVAKQSAERNILAKLREQVGARHINPKALAEYGRALVVFAHSDTDVKQGCEMLRLAADKAPHNERIGALLHLIPRAV